MEVEKVNPYWADLERHHNFSRERLVLLLRECGFEIADFAIGGGPGRRSSFTRSANLDASKAFRRRARA